MVGLCPKKWMETKLGKNQGRIVPEIVGGGEIGNNRVRILLEKVAEIKNR
jgi:hypothetical protein